MRAIKVASVVLTVLVAMAGFGAALASASTGPAWRIDALTNTTIEAGATGHFRVEIANVGDTNIEAAKAPVTVTASFPGGIKATEVEAQTATGLPIPANWSCAGTVFPAATVTCHDTSDTFGTYGSQSHVLLLIGVTASAGLSPGTVKTAQFQVAGGGALTQATVAATRIGSAPPFGLATLDALTGADGERAPATQAGEHPYDSTVSFEATTFDDATPLAGDVWPVAPIKDTYTYLPAGLVGNPTAVAQCTSDELSNSEQLTPEPLCPADSQVGVAVIRFNGGGRLYSDAHGPVPVFNMKPPPGVPAQFGFNVIGTPVLLDAKLREGGHAFAIVGHNVSAAIPFAGATVTLWGTPASPIHDAQRACSGEPAPFEGGPHCASGLPEVPFLRSPTSCGGVEALRTSMSVDSWLEPGRLGADGLPDLSDPAWSTRSALAHEGPGYPYPEGEWGAPVQMEGCEDVPVAGSLATQPTSTQAQSPTGLVETLEVPNPGLEKPEGTSTSDLKAVRVELPEGVALNPAQAGGLAGCTPAQWASEEAALTPDPERGCPATSKVATVLVHTPLLEETVGGEVFVAQPYENPFKSLVALYVVLKSPQRGILVKIAGDVTLDPSTGRITASFDNLPQLPFETMTLRFKEGSRAPLVTPAKCGSYQTEAQLTPWSDPSKPIVSRSTFTVSSGPGGGGCPAGALPFAPALTAGSSDPVAGAFTPFTLQLTRGEGDQQLASLSAVTLPPGLLADIGSVPQCSDAQVAAAACPADTRLGGLTVGAGAGSEPVYVSGGNVYLTGPYKGAPFGLAIVIDAKAGPFDLGNVIVRGALRIDPHTAQAIVETDPFPTILQGIPLQVRDIRVSMDRPHFTINPTNCETLQVTGAVNGTEGGHANVSSRYQVGECRSMKFKPKFVVLTSAAHSRKNGASLKVKVTYPKNTLGKDANLRYVKVKLPKGLPSRFSTLKEACTAEQFDASPTSCPAASVVGHAVVHTPLLSVPLEGPAYFVSHGGEAFPNLTIVLQGDGITVDLVGDTLIKHGVTSSTFHSTPDVPFESFVLTLPKGPHSALDGNGSFCRKKLIMPTRMVGQNGKVIEMKTKVRVQGCKRGGAGRPRGRGNSGHKSIGPHRHGRHRGHS